MPLSHKPLKDLTEADLTVLVTNNVREGRTIEFKRALPGASDDDKREFLKDVSALANANGGDLLYGVAEDDGVAIAIEGVPGAGLDDVVLRLHDLERTGLDPRIIGVDIRGVPIGNGRVVLVVRVPRSWQAPHMIVFRYRNPRFYTRTSNGAHPLDVHELRAAFLQSESIVDRVRQFRLERLARIAADETPAVLRGRARLVFHLVPLVAARPGSLLDVRTLADAAEKVSPMSAGGCSRRFNLDGIVVFDVPPTDGPGGSYVQVFRTGAIEFVDATHSDDPARPFLRLVLYEGEILAALGKARAVTQALGIGPPLVIALTWLGVRGYRVYLPPEQGRLAHAIDRDELLIPEIVTDEIGVVNLGTIMKPAFDAVANACGLPASPQYDAEGTWRGR